MDERTSDQSRGSDTLAMVLYQPCFPRHAAVGLCSGLKSSSGQLFDAGPVCASAVGGAR